MTAQELLLLILLAILVQLLVFAGVTFVRYWQDYRELGDQADADDPPAPLAAEIEETAPAWAGLREFRVSQREIEDLADSVCSFHLQPVDGQALPSFHPGQFLTFELQVATADSTNPADKKTVLRCYSLSDAAQPDHYRISIKRVAPARPDLPAGVSSNHFHDHVQVGDVLRVKAPSGHFHLDTRETTPVVLIAGGIGITPIFSMLSAALQARPEREIWLFYGVRNSREMVFRKDLESLAAHHPNFHLQRCFSEAGVDDIAGRDFEHAGRVDVACLRMSLNIKPYHFYLCGPGAMMATLVPALEDWGIASSHIHYEAFGPASVTRAKQSLAGPIVGVTFALSGRRLEWSGGSSLLDFAEASGIRVDSGCRAGGCGACQTRIESGEVYYEQTPEFDVEPGNCLLCLAKPRTELVLTA